MADERIIELDTINEVPADGYLAIDTVTGDTYKILPIKIGAQYTIQDGDHSFTLVGSNGYSHTVNIPYDSETINLADFNQLTPEEQDNGTAYYVPDKDVPVANELWAKVGRTQLDGSTQDLSKAHNNLMARVDDLEDTVGDTALPSGMSSVTDGISQLNSILNSFSTWKTWQPQLYDYTTYKRNFSANGEYRYLELGSLVIAFINVNNQDYSDINTMLQIRNLPMNTVLSGICYFAGNATAGADKVVQMLGGTNHLYPRPNITSTYFSNPTSSGWTSILIFGGK